MRTLGLSRFQLKYAVGTLPHAERLESIRLYGTEVVPRVRELLAATGPPDRSGRSDALVHRIHRTAATPRVRAGG